MSAIRKGDAAPNATLTLQAGDRVALADLWQKNPVVLFFYPKDGSFVCTREACAFRDAHEAFVAAGATVIGVSADSVQSHRAFADEHRLPYLLATDEGGALRRAFGVPKSLGLMPGRVTYVIDREGIVQRVFNAQFAADRHVRESLEALRQLE
jgi:thioredoxin-dependent peroxiredoxin